MIDEIKAEEMYIRNDVLKNLQNQHKDILVNELYNNYIRNMADNDKKPYNKVIPYIGWFWIDCNFVDKLITIENCGDFIGIMENNEWNYPERVLTKSEVNKFIELLDKVMAVNHGSGDIILFYKSKRLDDLWSWMQTLTI